MGRVRKGRSAAGALAAILAGSTSAPAQEVVELPGTDALVEARLTVKYVVGGLDAEAWAQFVGSPDASFGPDGRLYLADEAGRSVIAVEDGALIHRLGSEGDGPGQYRAPSGIVALEAGTVAVWDARKRAFLVYGADGASRGEIRPGFEIALPEGPFTRWTAAGAGSPELVALPARMLTSRLGRAYLTGSGVTTADGRLPLLRVPLRDRAPVEVLTTVAVPVLEGPPPHPVVRAFEPEPSWGPLADGRLALHDGDRYRIRVVTADGRVERVLTRPIAPRPVEPDDRRAFLRSVEDRPVRALGPGGAGGARRAPPDAWFHPVVPAVRRIATDGVGTIWVERPDPDDPTRPGPIDILDAEGRYVGTLPPGRPGLPVAFGPDGLIAVVDTGELDVPRVRVYGLEGLRR